MKIPHSPQKIIDIINDYFGVDVTINKRGKGYSEFKRGVFNTRIALRKSTMKILRENFNLKDSEIGALMKCGRSNICNMVEKTNQEINFNAELKSFYILSLNLIERNLNG